MHTLRGWCRDDLAAMTALVNARVEADGEGESVTEQSMAAQYDHLVNCDPATDIVVAESADGDIVGYSRTLWEDTVDSAGNPKRMYFVAMEADPRAAGVDEALLRWGVGRAAENAAGHDHRNKRVQVWAAEGSRRFALIERLGGFAVARWSALLVRPLSEDIGEYELPADVTVRPAAADQLRAIFEADVDAVRDQEDFVEPTEQDWARFLDDEADDMDLWQIAWDGAGVVGQVRTYVVDGEEQRLGGRRRAWTEDISCRADRRRQGIASALITRSLRQLRDLGYDEAALGADYDNPHRALGLYESLGYQVVQRRAVLERSVG